MQVEKIPISTPRMVIGNSKGVVGLNCQSFEGKYEAKLEIPARRGRGSKNYITLVEVWIFSGTTLFPLNYSSTHTWHLFLLPPHHWCYSL